MQQSLKITDVSDALSAMKEKKLEEIEAEHHEPSVLSQQAHGWREGAEAGTLSF